MSQRWTPIDHTLELMPCVAPFSLPVTWPMTCSNQSSVCCGAVIWGPFHELDLRGWAAFPPLGTFALGNPGLT